MIYWQGHRHHSTRQATCPKRRGVSAGAERRPFRGLGPGLDQGRGVLPRAHCRSLPISPTPSTAWGWRSTSWANSRRRCKPTSTSPASLRTIRSHSKRSRQISERLGRPQRGGRGRACRAGETFLKQRDLDKAIENWSRVTALRRDHPLAHSRLAMAHEHLGQKQQAVTEYLAVASILQRGRHCREGPGGRVQGAAA